MQDNTTGSFPTDGEATETEIVALVGPSGAGNGRVPPSPTWTVLCTVVGWRVVGQALEETPITLVQQGTKDDMRELQNTLRPYTIIRARVRVRSHQPTHADMVALLDTAATDAELEAQAEALRESVTYEDAIFGTLTFDRSLDWWTADVTWNGEPTTLHVSADDDGLDDAIAVAHALWHDQAAWHKRLTDYAAQELLDLKNDAWLDDEDDEPVTAQQFVGALGVESVNVDPDGHFEVYYDDGDLFFGHVIIVSGTVADGPDDANIAG